MAVIATIFGVMYFAQQKDETIFDEKELEKIEEKVPEYDNENMLVTNQTLNSDLSQIKFTATGDNLTVADLKEQFRTAGVDDTNAYMFKPFYNVEQNTEFTFHFNSKVDPIKAITVHTDEKCDYLSLVWQINTAYWTDDGIDVIVGPGTAVLDSDGRNGSEKGIWGYAPIYYLRINYDLESKEVKKLEKPIIIPFTIKNEISTPTVYANIDEKGNFSIKWNKVEGAKSYKVYSGMSPKSKELTVAETGYQDSPKLVATLNASELEFNPGYLLMQEKVVLGGDPHDDNTVREKDSEHNIETVRYQNNNIYNLYSFYITAVDAKGNESNYGIPVMLNEYKKTLPKRVSDLSRHSDVTEFPQVVNVESVDMKTLIKYPVNFYKIEEPSEFSNYCDYRYEVVGTELKGIITYKSEEKIFPAEHISTFVPQASYMPQNTMDKIPQVTVDTFADNDYSNSKIDLSRKTNYPESAKVQLDAGNIYVLLDMDGARRVIGIPDLEATDPREEFDSFVADGDPEYVVRKEGDTLIVEKVEKISSEDENKPVVEEPKEELPKEEPAKVIDNTNYVEEQQKSTEKQVKEADKEVIKGTKYPIFADNAAQMYLALAMVNQEEVISLKAFPEYHNLNNLADDLYYLWYQNPYIMGIDLEKSIYDYQNQELHLEYNVSKAKAKEYQESVYVKAQKVVDEIIKNNMTDEEKVFAIYEYLEENGEYNHDAYDYAMTGATDVYQKYSNSWNTYGILCEEKGVCQSYAYAFDVLADLSGLESIMVTGTLNNGGHAWNAVKISGNWCMIDVTNNKNVVGIPYWICNTSTDFINEVAFALDDGFVDGTSYAEFADNDEKSDWYYVHNLMADSGSEMAKIWEENHKTNDQIFIKCPINSEAEFEKIFTDFQTQAQRDGYSLKGWGMAQGAGFVLISK